MPKLLEGKRGLIFGAANKSSIAWAIAKSMAREGASLAFAYQGDRIKEKVEALAATLSGSQVFSCDLTREEEVDNVFKRLGEVWHGLDFLIHSVAFARAEDLEGSYVKTKKANYEMALGVSAYSLTLLARKAAPLLESRGGGSIVTMTYLGSERVAPHYNVMGVAKAALESSVRYLAYDLGPRNIRVNAISAGPINTLAARGIAGFTEYLKTARQKAPLRRNTSPDEVGDTALFLCSPLGRGITGQIIFVDCGYSTLAI
jgi:enoyl-[acyl-carrier protein] reductase I